MVFKRNINNNKMVIMVNILSGYLYALHANLLYHFMSLPISYPLPRAMPVRGLGL